MANDPAATSQNNANFNPGLQNDDLAPTEQPEAGVTDQGSAGSLINETSEQTRNDPYGKLIRAALILAPAGTSEPLVAEACLTILDAYNKGKNIQVITSFGVTLDTTWAATTISLP